RRHTRSTRDWSSDVCSSDLARRALDAETSVEVKHEWPERVADDADPFEAEAPLSLLGGGQQGPGLHRNPESLFVLEGAFLEDAFDEEGGVNHVDFSVGAALDGELGHRLPVLEEPVVHDDAGNDERVLVLFALEREVTDLDPDLLGIGDRGVRRDKRPI